MNYSDKKGRHVIRLVKLPEILIFALLLTLCFVPLGSTSASIHSPARVTPRDHEESSKPQKSPLCRSDYVAETLNVELERQKLGDFIKHLNDKYQANIALDPELYDLEIRMNKVSERWTVLLKVIMDQYKLHKECHGAVASITRKKRC